MTTDGLPERRFRLLLVAFWIIPAVVGTLGFLVVPSRLNPTITPGALFVSQLGMWGTWGLWSLLSWEIGERVPFERGRMWRALAVYVPVGIASIALQIFLLAELSVAFGLSERHGLESTLALGLRSYGDTYVVLFCAIVGAQIAFRWYANWQAQRLVAARMNEDLMQAQLRALQAQLNPHFLFNALNSVVALIGRDPALAQRTVVRLADLLRATLRAEHVQEVPLAQELELTRRYLDIELVRFADRLHVQWNVPEPLGAALSGVVPAFALQPLVENALVHGIAKRPTGGDLTISAARDGTQIELRVCDNGDGLTSSDSHGTGVGLANLRARLERLYGAAASLTLHDRATGGAEAILRIPFRPIGAVALDAVSAGAI